MKREDVKNKIPGITEEQLNWLMQENGSDITREKFLSTLSLRRATVSKRSESSSWRHFYPRSPCGERRKDGFRLYFVLFVSIHALLAESDSMPFSLRFASFSFYPRSPCGERHSMFFATISPSCFYPRSPCGERQAVRQNHAVPFVVSIHALLAESDGVQDG